MTVRAEAGLTLIELLISIVILAVIGSALTESLMIGLRTTDDTSKRLGASSDAQILASYFLADAQSATDVSTTDTTCGGVTPIVRLKLVDPLASTTRYAAAYAISSGTIVRRFCVNDVTTSVQTVVRDLTSATCAPCSGSMISLAVTANGFTYQVDGRRRTT